MPARTPLWTSAFFTEPLSVCAVQPIFAAVKQTAAQRGMLAFVIQNHPHRSLADLGKESSRRRAHNVSAFSRFGASGNPGGVHGVLLVRSSIRNLADEKRKPCGTVSLLGAPTST
jgi:hypothetical protein